MITEIALKETLRLTDFRSVDLQWDSQFQFQLSKIMVTHGVVMGQNRLGK